MNNKFKFCIPVIATLLFFSTAGSSQVMKQKETPVLAKEWTGLQQSDNILDKLTPAEKAEAKQQAQVALAFFIKGVLNRANPSTYPLEAAADSPEGLISFSIKGMKPAAFNKMKLKIDTFLADENKKALILGKFKSIDFKKKSIRADVDKIHGKTIRPNISVAPDAAAVDLIKPGQAQGLGGASGVGTEMPAFNRMDLVLRAVKCVDETNPESPGDDDIVVGGLIIGCTGNVKKTSSIVSCHFDDGDYCNHGAIPVGTYNITACSGYPKTFYTIIQLVEADSDEAETAEFLSDVMQMVAVATAGTGYGAIFAAVAGALEMFAAIFFDDDAFYPYGVQLNLPSANAFGSDGRSNNWRTNGISDHGGTYQVGYYWQLRQQ